MDRYAYQLIQSEYSTCDTISSVTVNANIAQVFVDVGAMRSRTNDSMHQFQMICNRAHYCVYTWNEANIVAYR